MEIKELPNKVLRFFKSMKVTAAVISLMTLIYILGLFLPQKWMFDSDIAYEVWTDESIVNSILDYIGFTDIYTSPLTIALLTVFFVNLLVVTVNRVPVILKRAYMRGELPEFSADEIKGSKDVRVIASGMDEEKTCEKIGEFFRKRSFFFRKARGDKVYIAVKNRYSPIGFLLFHLSFVLCLIGGLMLSYTRFSGNLPLTEGQSFTGDMTQFRKLNKEPKMLKEFPSLELRLEEVRPIYEQNIPTRLTAVLQVRYDGELSREVIEVNEPVHRGQLSIIAQSIGISPLFIIKAPDGSEIDGAWVSLNVLNGEEDSFQFEKDPSVKFYVNFYPDYIVENGEERSKSIELKNPAVHLKIMKDFKKLYDGTLMKNEYAQMGLVKIGFSDIRYWVDFIIIREYGKLPLVLGFLFAAVGLIMRLVFYQKRMRLAVVGENDSTVVYVDGRSEYFQHSYKDEMDKLVDDLSLTFKRN